MNRQRPGGEDLFCSVVVPCYNEEEVLPEANRRLQNVLTEYFSQYEIIYVNDGSSDNTPSLLGEFCSNDPNTRLISFSRNFGHQAAVSAGIRNCAGDIAVILDADLQDPPELIPGMAEQWSGGCASVIYGVRRKRRGEGAFKRLSAKIYYHLLSALSDVSIPRDTGDFRLIDRKVIEQFRKLPEHAKFVRGLISWLGYVQEPFYYDRDPRAAGTTKYPLGKMIRFALNGITGFSRKPLQMALALGGISLLVGLLLVLYVFFSMFLFPDRTVPGWASTLIIIIFFSGIQLLTIGVLGEYLGRVFEEVKSRPEYIIAEKRNFAENKGEYDSLVPPECG